MLKRIIAVITGVVVGFIVVFIGDATTHKLNGGHAPDGMDREALSGYVSNIPVYVLVIMVLFWMLAAFLGGFIAAKINKDSWKQVSLITGGILFAATLLNLAMIPHPAWMWIAAVVLIIPAAFLGGKIALPKVLSPPAVNP